MVECFIPMVGGSDWELFRREVNICSGRNHRAIVPLVGFIYDEERTEIATTSVYGLFMRILNQTSPHPGLRMRVQRCFFRTRTGSLSAGGSSKHPSMAILGVNGR